MGANVFMLPCDCAVKNSFIAFLDSFLDSLGKFEEKSVFHLLLPVVYFTDQNFCQTKIT